MSSETDIQIEQDSSVTVVTIGPELEHLSESSIDRLHELLLAAAEEANPPRLLLDLSHVKMFGSSFIEVIFRAWHRLNARDDSGFGICGLTEYCQEILQVTHLEQLWNLYPDRASGVAALGAE